MDLPPRSELKVSFATGYFLLQSGVLNVLVGCSRWGLPPAGQILPANNRVTS